MQQGDSFPGMRIIVGPLPAPSLVGDAAIACGAVVLLREAFPGAQLCGWTMAPLTQQAVRADYERVYSVDELLYSPQNFLPLRQWAGWRREAANIVQMAGKYLLPALGRRLGRRAAGLFWGGAGLMARAIAEADLVILRGGGFLSSPHIFSDLCAFRLNALHELVLARAYGVPYALWGHTIWDLQGPLSQRILWPLIRDSLLTACREQRSYDYLVSQGAPQERLAVLPDTAFALQPAPRERVAEILKAEGLASRAPLIGVNVRPPWVHEAAYKTLTPRCLAAIAATLDHMYQQYGTHALLIYQGYSTDLHLMPEIQDDRAMGQLLMKQVRHPEALHELQHEYTPAERAGLYGELEMILSLRLHVGIMAALGGAPTAFIAYEKNKTHGIAEMLGLADYVIDIETIEKEKLLPLVEEFWQRRAELRQRLPERLAQIRSQLGQYAARTKAALADRKTTTARK